MAIGDSYAEVADLVARLGVARLGVADGTFEDLLDAASWRVEQFTRRQFNKETTATARRYRAVDPQRLPVDDFHTTSGLAVEVAGTVWDSDTYDPRPPDGIVDGQTGWPFFDLMAVSRYWPHNRRATIEVTAQWGWAAVPEEIKQATLDVASVMSYGYGSAPTTKTSESLGDHSFSFGDPSLTAYGVPAELAAAAPYRRKRFGVA